MSASYSDDSSQKSRCHCGGKRKRHVSQVFNIIEHNWFVAEAARGQRFSQCHPELSTGSQLKWLRIWSTLSLCKSKWHLTQNRRWLSKWRRQWRFGKRLSGSIHAKDLWLSRTGRPNDKYSNALRQKYSAIRAGLMSDEAGWWYRGLCLRVGKTARTVSCLKLWASELMHQYDSWVVTTFSTDDLWWLLQHGSGSWASFSARLWNRQMVVIDNATFISHLHYSRVDWASRSLTAVPTAPFSGLEQDWKVLGTTQALPVHPHAAIECFGMQSIMPSEHCPNYPNYTSILTLSSNDLPICSNQHDVFCQFQANISIKIRLVFPHSKYLVDFCPFLFILKAVQINLHCYFNPIRNTIITRWFDYVLCL